MYNFGSNCYLNTAIQFLFAIPEIRTMIKRSESNEIAMKALQLLETYFVGGINYRQGAILHIDDVRAEYAKKMELPTITNEMIPEVESDLKNKTIYNQLYVNDKYSQVDAFEFFILKIFGSKLLDKEPKFNELFGYQADDLALCLDGITQPIKNKENENEKTIQVQLYNEYDKPRLTEMISNNYGKKKSRESEELEDLIDNFKGVRYLQECINDLYLEEIYDPKENAILSDCISPRNPNGSIISHKITNYNTKKYVILILKRFFTIVEFNIQHKIKFPIIPNPVITIDNNKNYNLKSCIIHIGESIRGGHYIYLNFSEEGDPLYIIDDESVYLYDGDTNESHDYIKNGYIYLYEII